MSEERSWWRDGEEVELGGGGVVLKWRALKLRGKQQQALVRGREGERGGREGRERRLTWLSQAAESKDLGLRVGEK